MAPLGRLAICEKMDMHLTCWNGRIFLKPIPRFLLSRGIWETHLEFSQGGECGRNKVKGSVVIVQEKS